MKEHHVSGVMRGMACDLLHIISLPIKGIEPGENALVLFPRWSIWRRCGFREGETLRSIWGLLLTLSVRGF